MIDGLFAWLLLPLGFALGWAMRKRRPMPQSSGVDPEVTASLGELLSELQTDEAGQDAAPGHAEPSAQPARGLTDLQLSLGRMFRKRGEVDRALRLHENLLARQTLDERDAAQLRLELAQDYMAAGVMDRAETLFAGLVDQGRHRVEALSAIRTIHEQAHDWPHAIEAARRLEAAQGRSERAAIAQYHCELADEAQRAKQPDEALAQVRLALAEHPECVRAHLLLGALQEARQEPALAATAYLHAFEYDPRFLPEVIEPLQRCFAQTGDRAAYLQFIHDAHEISLSSLPFIAEARLLAEQGMDPLERLSEGLEKRPSRAVLAEFLEVLERQPQVIASGLHKPAASLRAALLRLMETTPRYQCTHCGFNPRQLFWQCPACKQWGTTAPADDVMVT